MAKTVLILFGLPDDRVGTRYEEPYRILYGLAAERGVRMVRASIQWFDAKGYCFQKYWAIENGQWRLYEESIVPDLVYDKCATNAEFSDTKRHIASVFRILNNPDFTEAADNKLASSLLVPEHFKPYLSIDSAEEFADLKRSMERSAFLVAKKAIGSGGDQVYIGSIKEFDPQTFTYPFIAQEYIDSSAGIPGVCTGSHDLRLVFIDTELIYAYVRMPKAGSHLANIAQGGTMFIVPGEKLPRSLDAPIRATQKAFEKFSPKIYTIDFMFDRDGRPWIIEFNTKPGLYFNEDERSSMMHFYGRLLDTFEQVTAQK